MKDLLNTFLWYTYKTLTENIRITIKTAFIRVFMRYTKENKILVIRIRDKTLLNQFILKCNKDIQK